MTGYHYVLREWSRANKAFKNAFLVLISKMPFEDIKALQIIKESGYSHSAFYNSFTDKYDLAEQIFQDEILRFAHIAYESIVYEGEHLMKQEVFPPFKKMFAHVYDNQMLYSHIIHRRVPGWGTSEFARRVTEVTKGYYNVTYKHSDVQAKVPFDFISFLATKQHLAIIEYWEREGFKYSADHMAIQATLVVTKGQTKTITANTLDLPIHTKKL